MNVLTCQISGSLAPRPKLVLIKPSKISEKIGYNLSKEFLHFFCICVNTPVLTPPSSPFPPASISHQNS